MPADSNAATAAFKRELVALIPHMRGFARGLCGRADLADDLVQDTLLRAWAARDRFAPGTSLKAWTFVILRNLWRSGLRRNRFHGVYDPIEAERVLVAEPEQEAPLHLADLARAMAVLPPERREALLLVTASGLSYEEAAAICGVAVGTIKSRVARARQAMAEMIEQGKLPPRLRHAAPLTLASFDVASGSAGSAPSGEA